MSLLNYYKHGNLSSRLKQRDITQTFTFKAKLPGLSDTEQPSITLHQYIDHQTTPTLQWLKRFQQAFITCGWSSDTALAILKALLTSESDINTISNFTVF